MLTLSGLHDRGLPGRDREPEEGEQHPEKGRRPVEEQARLRREGGRHPPDPRPHIGQRSELPYPAPT